MVTRRDFIAKTAAGACAVGTAGYSGIVAQSTDVDETVAVRELGDTRENVSMPGIGGWHLGTYNNLL